MRSLYVDRLLINRIEMVVPSPSVEVTLKRLAPRLREVQFHLVPHGIDMVPDYLPIATRSAGERLRIVVLGRLSRHKGTELLREACEELRSMAEIRVPTATPFPPGRTPPGPGCRPSRTTRRSLSAVSP